MDQDVLSEFEQNFPHLQTLITEIKIFYGEKKWHELSVNLIQLLKDEKVLQQGASLLALYDKFVKKFERKIDELKFVRFITTASNYCQSTIHLQTERLQQFFKYITAPELSIDFIEQIIAKSVKDEHAIVILRLKRASLLLRLNQFEEVQKVIAEIKRWIDKQSNVDQFVYSSLYKVSFEYHRVKKNYEEFYNNALMFLGYTNEEDMLQNEKLQLSLEMAIALLISPKIYNFSELLEQPVLLYLKQSQHSWIYQLLEIFNLGDVQYLNKELETLQNQIQTFEPIFNNIQVLKDKIRIMAFLDLIFNLSKNERTVTFQQISQKCLINYNEVELMVMRAMSLDLIKGCIDQIEGLVRVNWIIPRVLDKKRIEVIYNKFVGWNKGLNNLLNLVQEKLE